MIKRILVNLDKKINKSDLKNLKLDYNIDKIFNIDFNEKNKNDILAIYNYLKSQYFVQILLISDDNLFDFLNEMNLKNDVNFEIVLIKEYILNVSDILNNFNFQIKIKSKKDINQKMKIGAFCGKFYPPHIGHKSAIDYSLSKCDFVYIVISYNPMRNETIKNDFSGFSLDVNLIKEWFEKHYKDEKKIKVSIFDESKYRPYPYDRDLWAIGFKEQFSDVNVKIADESYREYNEKYFPECDFLAIDRDKINIHSTHLRTDLKKYFDYLLPEAKDYFINKINR